MFSVKLKGLLIVCAVIMIVLMYPLNVKWWHKLQSEVYSVYVVTVQVRLHTSRLPSCTVHVILVHTCTCMYTCISSLIGLPLFFPTITSRLFPTPPHVDGVPHGVAGPSGRQAETKAQTQAATRAAQAFTSRETLT